MGCRSLWRSEQRDYKRKTSQSRKGIGQKRGYGPIKDWEHVTGHKLQQDTLTNERTHPYRKNVGVGGDPFAADFRVVGKRREQVGKVAKQVGKKVRTYVKSMEKVGRETVRTAKGGET